MWEYSYWLHSKTAVVFDMKTELLPEAKGWGQQFSLSVKQIAIAENLVYSCYVTNRPIIMWVLFIYCITYNFVYMSMLIVKLNMWTDNQSMHLFLSIWRRTFDLPFTENKWSCDFDNQWNSTRQSTVQTLSTVWKCWQSTVHWRIVFR